MTDANILRRALDEGEASELSRLLEADTGLASREFDWGGCAIGPCAPISYLAQARFNGFVRHTRSWDLTRILLVAGAPVDGAPGTEETPLMTAASYYELEVARALVEAGASLEAQGIAIFAKNGTALAHAIEFGAVEIVDLLVKAGSPILSLRQAAGAGDVAGWLEVCEDENEKAFALRAAAICDRLRVIDEILSAGVPVNRFINGGTALHWAAWEAKADAARHLVSRGADATLTDPEHKMTALGWARHRSSQCPHAHPGGHTAVIKYLC